MLSKQKGPWWIATAPRNHPRFTKENYENFSTNNPECQHNKCIKDDKMTPDNVISLFVDPVATMMDNYIFDYVMPAITPNAWKILCLILRETWGAQRDTAQVSFREIRERTGISSDSTVNDALKLLIHEKYIFVKHHAVDPCIAAARVQTKSPQNIGGGVTCNWCEGRTLKLFSHHYPISAKDNGRDTVMICANCHAEYHYLVDKTAYALGEGLNLNMEGAK